MSSPFASPEPVGNDFGRDLAWSHAQSDDPMWEQVYRSAFPTFAGMQSVSADGWAQRGGIDRQVFLADGTVLKIDEKARRKVWPDFCLEYWSDEARRIPGWIAKPLTMDYLAYAFVPTRTCYLLPWHSLRRAWWLHRNDWVAQYREVRAQNPGYTTVSVAVPINVVLDAIRDAMVVQWGLTAA